MGKNFSRCICIIGILFLIGCSATIKTSYHPLYEPIYSEKFNLSINLLEVVDNRGDDPHTYYHRDLDTVQFDRPVKEIVKEAITKEFQRAGIKVSPSQQETSALSLKCEIIDFRAMVREEPLKFWEGKLYVVELSVGLRFKWLDTASNTILEDNERYERRSRKMKSLPVLPFDLAIIEEYGNHLINELLPRVIEKELRTNNILRKLKRS